MTDSLNSIEITKETFNPKIHVAEYKRVCNECGKVWHSLADREKEITAGLFGDFCGLCGTCGSPNQAQYSHNFDANNSTLTQLRKCPKCGSGNYLETIIYYEKRK
jgi:DNA-directed RNA polymerase subunit RPC12/RpoP